MHTGSPKWTPDKALTRRAIRDAFSDLWQSQFWRHISSDVRAPFAIENSFIGINIATQAEPECDEYVLARVRDLGIDYVRIDLSYDGLDSYPERLLQTALDRGLSVMLNIFPPRSEAKALENTSVARVQWKTFVQRVMQDYHDKNVYFEIGNTPNRQKWAGWSAQGYLQAWTIAYEVATQYKLKLAGPNISDFEPFYNLAYLSAFSRLEQLPHAQTDNLFVERVVEPEALDHRILGPWFTQRLKFNLVKKARTLHSIGHRQGVDTTIVSYTTWAMQRLSRWSRYPESKQADYLVRYLVLAAASNTLKRVYWGPLIDHRDGIIDDAARAYPEVDNVSHYKCVRGSLEEFRPRAAYKALRQIKHLLSATRCVQAVSAPNGLNHFVFLTQNDQEIHLCWCRDRSALALGAIYPQLSEQVKFDSASGLRLDYRPATISEQPLYITFSAASEVIRPSEEVLLANDNLLKQNIIVDRSPGWQQLPHQTKDWRGAVAFENTRDSKAAIAAMLPDALNAGEEIAVMRDTRNRIWTSETETHGIVAIKLNRVNRRKKIGYLFRDSKGRRHWDNASSMLRMGVNTPRPLAFFERHQSSGTSESYYVCAYLDTAFSARDVFSSIENGETHCRGMAHDTLLKLISEFICNMHNKGVLHRDLSPGNIMLQGKETHTLKIYLIDIGRARTGLKLTSRQRMIDLMRICFKLKWSDRETFIQFYNDHLGKPVAWWWRMAVRYYIAKIESKRFLKNKLKRRGK